jgi:hypothetical protein
MQKLISILRKLREILIVPIAMLGALCVVTWKEDRE